MYCDSRLDSERCLGSVLDRHRCSVPRYLPARKKERRKKSVWEKELARNMQKECQLFCRWGVISSVHNSWFRWPGLLCSRNTAQGNTTVYNLVHCTLLNKVIDSSANRMDWPLPMMTRRGRLPSFLSYLLSSRGVGSTEECHRSSVNFWIRAGFKETKAEDYESFHFLFQESSSLRRRGSTERWGPPRFDLPTLRFIAGTHRI